MESSSGFLEAASPVRNKAFPDLADSASKKSIMDNTLDGMLGYFYLILEKRYLDDAMVADTIK